MKKKLKYAFLVGLISTACMAGTGSGKKTPRTQKSIHTAQKLPKKPHTPPSKKSGWADVNSFRQDIQNHPLLWGFFGVLGSFVSFIVSKEYTFKASDEPKGKLVFLANFPKIVRPLLFVCIPFLFYVFPSLILAMGTSRWRGEGKKEETLKSPSFSVRFWRLIRFTFSPNIFLLLLPCLLTFVPNEKLFKGKKSEGLLDLGSWIVILLRIAAPLLTCIAGFIYAIWEETKKQDKKERKEGKVQLATK